MRTILEPKNRTKARRTLTERDVRNVLRFVRVARPEVKARVIRMMQYSIRKAEAAA
jgi:hypothetical protein